MNLVFILDFLEHGLSVEFPPLFSPDLIHQTPQCFVIAPQQHRNFHLDLPFILLCQFQCNDLSPTVLGSGRMPRSFIPCIHELIKFIPGKFAGIAITFL